MKQSNNQLHGPLNRLGHYMGSKRPLVYLGLVCSGLAHVVALAPFIFIWLILRELLSSDIDSIAINRWAWWAVGTGILYILLYWMALMLTHVAAFRIERSLRGSAMGHMLEMPLGFFDKQDMGKLKNVIDDNASLVHTFCAHQLPDLVGTFVCFVVLCVVMFLLDWRMASLCLIPVLIQLLAMGSMMSNKTYKETMGAYMNHLQRMSSEAVEYVRGMPVVKVYQQSIYSFNAFHQTILDHAKWAKIYTKSCRRVFSIYTVASFGYAFILVPFAFYLLTRGESLVEVVSSVIFFILVTPFIGECTMRLMYVVSGKREAMQALDRLDALCTPACETEKPGKLSLSDCTIKLDGVSFRYKPDDPLAVDNVTLSIPAGKRVALVGASGSGKTTLARLVARFWDVESGQITIGGVDISQVAAEEVLRQISFVFQSERLFKKSIRENVTYGSPLATEEQIYEALDKAQCLDLVRSLPHGLETEIGSKGVYLSGGEQQRIALARAFLKDAPILLLDEATSFADPESEHAIQEALHHLMEHKTVLMIAHRLSSVIDADLIVVMQAGHIVEQGTHTELLAHSDGLYASMWQEYQESIEWTI